MGHWVVRPVALKQHSSKYG